MTAPLDLCICQHYRAHHGADQSLTSTTARCTHCSCSYFETVEDAEKYSHLSAHPVTWTGFGAWG
jgi:hypothetical protein